jgi:hypothetical protein
MNKTIKIIETRSYSIELVQTLDDMYYIIYNDEVSEKLPDLNMALFLFDMKQQELEGR